MSSHSLRLILSVRELLKNNKLLSKTRELRNLTIMLIRLSKDMKRESSKSVKTSSRSGLIRQRSLKLKNSILIISMTLRDGLSKILKMREISRLLVSREKEQFLKRRSVIWKADPKITLRIQSRRILNLEQKFNKSMNKVVWKREQCKMSSKNGRLILLRWRDNLLTLSIVMTEIEHFGKVSLISLKNKRTSTRRTWMRLSLNSKKMLSSCKRCKVMVRARLNRLINKFLLNKKLSTMPVLKIFKINLMKLFMRLNRRLNLLRENLSNCKRSMSYTLKILCQSRVRSLRSMRRPLKSLKDCNLSWSRPRPTVIRECVIIKPRLIS